MQQFRVKSTAETFWGLYYRLQAGKPFVYTRYGDGELELMLGGWAAGQPYHPGLAEDLRALYELRDPRNMVGLARHENETSTTGVFESWQNPRYKQFDLEQEFENAVAPHAVWYHKPHLMRALLAHIKDKPKTYVGALNGPGLVEHLGQYTHVAVPDFDAYASIDQWYPAVEVGPPIVIVAAGAAKATMARRLLASGRPVQVLDFGSLVDAWLGVESRTWIRQHKEK